MPGGRPAGWNPLERVPGEHPGIADEFGNLILDTDTDGDVTGDALTEFSLYNSWNGSFSIGPAGGLGSEIKPGNVLPYFDGPTSVSGGSMTARWDADSGSPSGRSLFIDVASGGASDEVYFEQIVPIGGSRARWTGAVARAFGYLVSGAAGFNMKVQAAFLDADGNLVGSNRTVTAVATAAGFSTSVAADAIGGSSPGATARRLRLRFGVTRGAAAVGDTATIAFTDVRLERAVSGILVGERSTPDSYAAGYIVQRDGALTLSPDSPGVSNPNPALIVQQGPAGSAYVKAVVAGVDEYFLVDAGHLRLTPAIAVPATPAAGYQAFYVKADRRLYSKDDSGNELAFTTAIPPLAADVSKSGTTYTDITGLSFPVKNGMNYAFEVVGTYAPSLATNGLAIAYNHPGGNGRVLVEIASTGPAALTLEWLTATDTATGTTTTDSATGRFFRVSGRFQCTADGTFAVRYKRQGAGAGTITIQQGSGGWYSAA